MPGVSYRLLIDGEPASPELIAAIQQIEVEDHAEEADMLRLRLSTNVRADGSGWTVLDDDVFPRLANLRLTVAIGSRTTVPLIDAYVIETTAALANEPGASALTVVAMDPTVLMHLEERVRPWPNMTDGDVAAAIFSDAAYGFTPVVESTRWTRQEEEQTLIQRGTDIRFLHQLAERNGYECFVQMNPDTGEVEGHFHPPQLDEAPQGVLTVNMGPASNVTRFEVRFDMLGPTTATATGLDIDSGEDQPAQAEGAANDELGTAAAVPAERPRRVLLSGTGMGQSGELQTLAQAVVDRSAWAIEAEGELNTTAFGNVLRAKRPVMVRGAGRLFSGTYYVEKVLHSFTSEGYTQLFTLRRNAVGLTGRESFTEDDALP
jgi:phage protein D